MEAFAVFEERLTAKAAPKGNYGFGPLIIFAIIQALMALFESCKNVVPAEVKKPSMLNRARVMRALSRHISTMQWKERAQAAADVLEVAAEAKDEEITAFVAGCC